MRLIIYRATLTSPHLPVPQEGHTTRLEAGEILALTDKDQLFVAAGDQSVVDIVELQPAGKRRMPATEFLRGHRPKPGDRLGPGPK